VRRVAAVLAGLIAAATPAAAAACTVEAGYRVPSNLELAAAAETIVLARVVEGRLDPEGPEESTVTIRPLATLKGDPPLGDIALRGMTLLRAAGALGGLSNPYEFAEAHPLSYVGGCIRSAFPLGTTALFFLRTDHEGMWAPAGDPFTRWAEDVPGPDAPWVQLVRFYVAGAALPEDERRALLEAEREALALRADEPVAQLMAADNARQLAGADAGSNEIVCPDYVPPDDDGFRQSGSGALDAAREAMRQGAE
jgi:hypothetical protein